MPRLTRKASNWLRGLTGASVDPVETGIADPPQTMEGYSQSVSDRIQAWRDAPLSRELFNISDLDLDLLTNPVIVELQTIKLEEYQAHRADLIEAVKTGNGDAACTALFVATSALQDASTLARKLSEEGAITNSRLGWLGPQLPFVQNQNEILNRFEGLVERILTELEGRITLLQDRYSNIVNMVEDTIDEMEIEGKRILTDEEKIKSIKTSFNTAEQTLTEIKTRTDNLPGPSRLRRVFPSLADRYDAINAILRECNFMTLARQITQRINPGISLGI